MRLPKFQVGDRVMPNNRDNHHQQQGMFLIRQIMPFDRNTGFCYRAESVFDNGLRVFREDELLSAS